VSSPRILFVDHTGALGGAELYLLDIARHYRDRCTVLLFEEGPFLDRLQRVGVRAEVLPGGNALEAVSKQSGVGSAVRSVPALVRLGTSLARKARDYDLIFANSQKALIVTGPASWWARRPLLWNLHDLLLPAHFSKLNRYVAVQWANLFAHRVIANSKATAAAFRQSGGRAPTTVVYNGLDPDRFEAPSRENVEALRMQLGLGDAPSVGVFSRLAPWKGQHVLLEALPDLPDVHALLVGGALFGGDDSYAQQLRHQADTRGVHDRVHFLGFRDDIPTLMHLVDVVAHTSTAPEPFGRVIVEGMLAHTPVVATAAGGALEIIDDGTTGLLVPPKDPSSLRRALQRLLNEELDTEALTNEAHRMARRRFSISAMLNDIDRVIRNAPN